MFEIASVARLGLITPGGGIIPGGGGRMPGGKFGGAPIMPGGGPPGGPMGGIPAERA